MTAPAAEPSPARSSHAAIWLARSTLPALLISAAATAWCRSATGPTLGLFLGGLLLATLIAPPLTIGDPPRRAWLPITGIILGTALVWAASLQAADVSIWEWLRCSLVLAAYILALGGLASLLVSIGIPSPPAAGLVILLGLLWLTWPVWLSRWLTQSMADWLVPANTVFAVNATLRHLGTWDRAPLAYRVLTSLNQDVPYRLPGSIAPACVAHALIGAVAMLLATRFKRDIVVN